jgi:DNA-directed RNA polymerase subunit L
MGGVFQFTLSRIPVCYANALRRTVLSEIPICVIRTETEEVNQCTFEINTTRFHNEILKQRLSCIPIHIKDLKMLPGKYILELDVQNETDEIMYVTTEQFRIKNKETGNYTTKEQTQDIFPVDPITHDYIDFCRLRPKISDTIPGEQVKFSAEFSVATATVNSMFNAVSKCTYRNTQDATAAANEWKSREVTLREKLTTEEIEFEKRNFELLDAERYFVPNSFDYSIQTIGIYDNNEVMIKACVVLQNKFVDMIQSIASNEINICKSETSMNHCYDIILEHEDYTLGKIIEHVLYERYYVKDKTLSFCGFKKMHPHLTESVLRLAFNEPVEKDQIRHVLKEACKESCDKIEQIYKLF